MAGPNGNFLKTLDRNGNALNFLQAKFPKLRDAKPEDGILVGLQITELLHDSCFELKLNFIHCSLGSMEFL
jgi:hypothetical protein